MWRLQANLLLQLGQGIQEHEREHHMGGNPASGQAGRGQERMGVGVLLHNGAFQAWLGDTCAAVPCSLGHRDHTSLQTPRLINLIYITR